MRRTLLAASVALGVCAFYVWLIYAFFQYIWPHLPLWATLIVFLLLSVLVIGSPILALARLARRMPMPRKPHDGD